MSFFGMTKQGKTAQRGLQEAAGWNAEKAKQWDANATQFKANADKGYQSGMDYWTNRAKEGIPSVSDVRQTGTEIMPGTEQARKDRWERLNEIQRGWKNLTPVSTTMDALNTNMDQQAGNITGNYDTKQGEINDSWGRQSDQNQATNRDVMGTIRTTYDPLRAENRDLTKNLVTGADTLYGGLRKDTAGTYGRLNTSLEDTYGTSDKNLEMLRPGGEFQTASVGRQFNPVVASTADRMRRMGASGPQTSSVLAGVEADKARAMDEASARSVEDYISKKNELLSGRQTGRERLGTGELTTDAALATEGGAVNRGLQKQGFDTESGLSQEQGALSGNEVRRYGDTQSGVEAGRHGETMANTDQAQMETKGWLQDKAKLPVLQRAMEQGDWSTASGILGQMNDEELTQLAMSNEQFGQGMNYILQNLTEQDKAQAAANGMTDQQYAAMLASSGMAQGYDQSAQGANRQVYGTEAANAGWGLKALAGAGSSALNAWLGRK